MIIWKAKLDNGETRAGSALSSSWKGLSNFIRDNDVNIISLKLVHENGREFKVPEGAPAYFFGKRVKAQIGSPRVQHRFGIGYMKDDGLVEIRWWLPNFQGEVQEVRTAKECGFFLIRNKCKDSNEERKKDE